MLNRPSVGTGYCGSPVFRGGGKLFAALLVAAFELLPLAAQETGTGPAGAAWAGDATQASVPTVSQTSGPTLRLDYSQAKSVANPVSSFMYFIPLISPDAVTCLNSRSNTQVARVTSAKRKTSATSFNTKCEFEFSGAGYQQSLFDLTNHIRRNEQKLKNGGLVQRQLSSITVEGPGSGLVEVEGVISNGVQVVTEVRLRFNAGGKASPVSIGLCDLRYHEGKYEHVNQLVARVNTLKFKRQPGRPKMEVSLASVSEKEAGKNWWQSFKGGVKGMAANLLIPPLTVEAAGHRTMLDFGRALTAGDASFTFPRARNLRSGPKGQSPP